MKLRRHSLPRGFVANVRVHRMHTAVRTCDRARPCLIWHPLPPHTLTYLPLSPLEDTMITSFARPSLFSVMLTIAFVCMIGCDPPTSNLSPGECAAIDEAKSE